MLNMLEKLEMLMKEQELKRADVAKGANIPYTTFRGLFEKGYENVTLPTLRKLATFFDVSMEYLANDEVTDRNFGKILIGERDLYNLWRKLPRDEQMKLLGRMEAKVEEQEE